MPSVRKHRLVLGETIRKHRKQIKLSQEKLAERAELSTVFISELETGKKTVSVDALMRIAKSLRVNIRAFFEEF